MDKTQFIQNGAESAPAQVVLAHGAGAPMDSPFMNRFAEGLAKEGIGVTRFEFPYMQQRRTEGKKRPPNPQPVLLQTWHSVLETFQDVECLVIGGKSMGGRMASLLADEERVQGLLCLGYPFHPPGKPEKTRVAHLEHLNTPTLVIQGARDALGNQAEVAQYLLSENITLHWLADGDHSFKPRKSSGRTEAQNLNDGIECALQFIESLLRQVELQNKERV